VDLLDLPQARHGAAGEGAALTKPTPVPTVSAPAPSSGREALTPNASSGRVALPGRDDLTPTASAPPSPRPAAGRRASAAGVQRRLLTTGGTATAALAAAVALGLLTTGLAVAQAWLLAHAIAAAFLGGADVAALASTLAALALVLLGRAGLSWASELVAVRISARVKTDLRGRVMAAAVARGPRLAAERSSARTALLATRGLDALDGFYARYVPQLALAAIVPAAVVVCLAAVDLVAAATVALTVPLIPVFMTLIGQMSASYRDRRWAALGRLAHRFADVVAGLPTLRAFGRAEAQVATLRRVTDAYRVSTIATLRVAFLSAMVLELLATISVALVAVGVGLRLQAGDLGLEAGLFALVLAPEAYLPLRRLGAEFHAAEEGVAAARDVFALLDEAAGQAGPAPAPSPGASAPADAAAPAAAAAPAGTAAQAGAMLAVRGVEPPARISALRIEGVSIVQPGRDVEAPAGASLEVRPGEVVAVTGPSGAGKSTLLGAVLGFARPTTGRVSVAGSDGSALNVTSLDPEAWLARIAWVPQTPYLAPGSVAENVRLGAPGASDESVAGALAAVGLGDVALDRVLGERGSGLSGGQRRRIGVARAIARRAPVLLLDEPTAGLDVDAERQVLAAVRAEAERGAIVLLVAHRPGAVAEADRSVPVQWRALGPGVDAEPSPVPPTRDEPSAVSAA
jgi:thiol reductant ABC exporter CydD subunit